MNTLVSLILSYLANSLWQVPLLYAAAWLAARILRPLGPVIEHRIWVVALLLQAVLPALSIISLPPLPSLLRWLQTAHENEPAKVSVTLGAGFTNGTLHFTYPLESTVALLYLCICLYFCLRFVWRSVALFRIRREAMLVPGGSDLARIVRDFTSLNGLDDVELAISSKIASPATIGILHRLILLPANMTADLSQDLFSSIVAHEGAHLLRRDFAKNIAYELLTLPISYHPMVWLSRNAVVETREMACDQIAVLTIGSSAYAHSLLRLASLMLTTSAIRAPHAIGILDANVFERRLMTLVLKHKQLRGFQRAVVVLICLAFGAATCGTALALRLRVDKPASEGFQTAAASQTSPLKVESGVMAGNIQSKATPVYPPDAKAKRIQGAVVLHALIGRDGTIDKLTVLSGPKELQGSAIDAVSKWVYKPYLLNGDPVVVDTTITVTYSLG